MTRLVDLKPDADVAGVPLAFADRLARALGLDWARASTHDDLHALAVSGGLSPREARG
jgi:hypothetical protein